MKPDELADLVKRALLHELAGLPKPMDRILIIAELLADEGRALQYAMDQYLPVCRDYLRGKDDLRLDEAWRLKCRLGGVSNKYYALQGRTFVDMMRLIAPRMPDEMVNELGMQVWRRGWLRYIERPALSQARARTAGR